MPLHPTVTDIAIRLALTMLAGGIIGLNRGARGHAAGFRTTILVCLAASVAMIQANILLPLAGKKGLITGIANDKSIAYAVAKAVVALGGEVALTYQNEKTAKYTQPLAEGLGAELFEKLDVAEPGSLEGVIAKCGEVFGEIRPATTIVEVAKLIDGDAKIEIEADAVVA